MMKTVFITTGIILGIIVIFAMNDFLYTDSWYSALHVRIEKTWLQYHDDKMDGARREAIRKQYPIVLAQALEEKNIEICAKLPESSFLYFRDKDGNISFEQPYTGAVPRPHREGWWPRTECQRTYIETTFSWELCPVFDREESWLKPDTCRILVARAIRKHGLGYDESKKPCMAIIDDQYRQDLCLDTSY